MKNLLEVSNLSVKFETFHGTVEAVDKANLIIKEGEVIGLVGESGCGKTTLARAILNVIPSPPGQISNGEILFRGENILLMEEKALNTFIRGKAITLIPQDPLSSFNPLFPIGTQIKDIVGRKLKNHLGRQKSRKYESEMKRRIIKILNEVQLPSPEDFLAKYPHELSGGQRQRIMIAMALVSKPSLIIADEPTTFLDVTVQFQILHILTNLVKEQNVSVLYITHNLAVASQISDRIIVMYAGQVMESAPTDSFFANPSHPYTRKLLECLPSQVKEIRGIPGSVPSLINPPKGCRFFSRCDNATSECLGQRPSGREISSHHWVYCHKYLRDKKTVKILK